MQASEHDMKRILMVAVGQRRPENLVKQLNLVISSG